ncbi:enoyl-CoA hydratase-related protein [Pseudonocardia humida]|uniref:Enoyl-CoA hydratase/isomerase family protein n=1 Tax=Pseudonocardia humida TaxID=2800819 RepID=A0ABT1A9N8_9PSEU|nr:enoyl-CoA hydratase-related protein [Pseudonocardia humida]MCO1659708.1 enoyl-CoA hydratase/isomerase family protein [Pseudonocardia humida]
MTDRSGAADYTQIVLEQVDKVAIIRMNRPQYRNAQSRILREELDHAFARCEADDSVSVVVFTGVGDHFSAGHDLGTPEELRDREVRGFPTDARGRLWRMHEFNVANTMRWRDFRKPTIAAVHGYTIFAGWLVASAMDVIVAADDTEFLPEFVQYFSMPWDVNTRKVKEILFEGRFVSAQEAHEIGFVNRVVPRAELEEHVLELAHRFAETDLLRLEVTKEAINAVDDVRGFRSSIETSFLRWSMLSEAERAQVGEGGMTSDASGRPRRPRAQRAFDRLKGKR